MRDILQRAIAMFSVLRNLLLFLSFFCILSLLSAQKNHPLDTLTQFELIQVQTIVKKSYPSSQHNVSFHYVGLDEPDKSLVLSWQSNCDENLSRRAIILARIDLKSHEIIIDLSSNSIVLDKVYNGHGYPILSFEEQTAASKLAIAYAPLVDSIKKRGLKIEEVVGFPFTVGWYGEKRSNRIVRVMCYYLDGTVNLYMRPIEGITATVDLDQMKVIAYRDRITVPVPKAEGTEYREEMQKPPLDSKLKSITMLQPDGPSFSIDGHIVR